MGVKKCEYFFIKHENVFRGREIVWVFYKVRIGRRCRNGTSECSEGFSVSEF
jgi:hypothetical protein